MLIYEWFLLQRNKVSRIYFLTSFAASIVCGVLLFFIKKAEFEIPFQEAMMAFFALGAPLYIYWIYSFSWESSFVRISLKDDSYFDSLVNAKLYGNFVLPTLALLLSVLLFYGFVELAAMRPLFIAWIYSVIPGNLMTLWLTSYWIKKVDWYEDRFEIIKQPPAHILIVFANIVFFLAIYYLSNLFDFGLLILLIVSMLFWLILKPIMIKHTKRNLKNITYAIPEQYID